ncbi:MAG: chemotaxis protein CheD [Litorimonas sp.]
MRPEPTADFVWPRPGPDTLSVIQGDVRVSRDPRIVMSTLVGSCVSVCLFDPDLGLGGMNHYLLPGDPDQQDQDGALYGINQIELLINELMKEGAVRSHLQAKIFGGNRMMDGLTTVGERNARVAEEFIRDEGIRLVASQLRGDRAQKIEFHPASGRARTRYVEEVVVEVAPRPAPVMDAGDVDFF